MEDVVVVVLDIVPRIVVGVMVVEVVVVDVVVVLDVKVVVVDEEVVVMVEVVVVEVVAVVVVLASVVEVAAVRTVVVVVDVVTVLAVIVVVAVVDDVVAVASVVALMVVALAVDVVTDAGARVVDDACAAMCWAKAPRLSPNTYSLPSVEARRDSMMPSPSKSATAGDPRTEPFTVYDHTAVPLALTMKTSPRSLPNRTPDVLPSKLTAAGEERTRSLVE